MLTSTVPPIAYDWVRFAFIREGSAVFHSEFGERRLERGDLGAVLTALTLTLAPTAALAVTGDPADPDSAAANTNHQGSTEEVFVGDDNSELGAPVAPVEGGITPFNVTIPGNPYGCMAHTARVHGSYSFASVHSKNYGCTLTPDQSVVGSEIMKKGWLGQWHRVVYMQKEKASSYVEVDAKRVCSDSSMQTYRGNGYHRAVYGSTWYTARTSSDIETRFACNAHGV